MDSIPTQESGGLVLGLVLLRVCSVVGVVDQVEPTGSQHIKPRVTVRVKAYMGKMSVTSMLAPGMNGRKGRTYGT